MVDTPAEGGVDDLPVTGGEIDGPFAAWGFPTPPGAEGYVVNSVSEEELNPQGVDEWHPTVDPEAEVVPGQMRSDEEAVPAGVSKEEADLAETKEARLQDGDGPSLQARAGCGVYWPAKFEVCGAIKVRYDQLRGPQSFLMFPASSEQRNPDGVGWRQEFSNGYIYWHPRTGAHSVSLPVSRVWQRHGWEQGFLGYPTSGDVDLGNFWYKQSFEGGYVYTHNVPGIGSQASIQGAIYDKWQAMGGENGDLGFPISDELPTPDGVGRYNVFEGGMIYWTPRTGAQVVNGLAGALWMSEGYETSKYGYPTNGQYVDSDGSLRQDFTEQSLRLADHFNSNATVVSNGKEIGIDYARIIQLTTGADVIRELSELIDVPSLQSQSWNPPENGTMTTRRDAGGVLVYRNYQVVSTVPIGQYIYDLNHPRKTLHDFCTASVDIWGTRSTNNTGILADYRGPCAQHDKCYDRIAGYRERIGPCDKKFHEDLKLVCNGAYGRVDKSTLNQCNLGAQALYSGVRGAQFAKNIF